MPETKLSEIFRAAATNKYEYSAAKLRELRESSGLSQAEFGNRIGFYQADVSRYERGHHSMTLDRLAAACDSLGYELDISFHKKESCEPSAPAGGQALNAPAPSSGTG